MRTSAIMVAITLAASPVYAGPLGETVKGLNNASSGGGGGSSGGGLDTPPPTSSGDDRPRNESSGGLNPSHHHHYGRHYEPYYYYWGAPVVYVNRPGEPAAASPPTPLHVEVYGGVARVADSDGMLAADLRISSGRWIFGGRLNHYWEGPSMYYPQGSRLGLWDVDVGFKVLEDRQGMLVLEGGLGAVTFSPEARTELGGMVGARAMFWPSVWVALFGEARAYVLADDIKATALFGGVQLAFLRLGYRVTDFNVGPPLHGPEVGAAFRF
jgi:hypothetical protein